MVTLRGNFDSAEKLECLFGSSDRVSAKLITSKIATCLVPALPAGNTTVRVSAERANDPIDLSAPLPFEIRPSMSVTSLSPSGGAHTGGTLLTVHGRAFLAHAASCRIGARTVAATVRSDELLLCSTPALLGPGVKPGARQVQVAPPPPLLFISSPLWTPQVYGPTS